MMRLVGDSIHTMLTIHYMLHTLYTNYLPVYAGVGEDEGPARGAGGERRRGQEG
jgi:hypothetical protein